MSSSLSAAACFVNGVAFHVPGPPSSGDNSPINKAELPKHPQPADYCLHHTTISSMQHICPSQRKWMGCMALLRVWRRVVLKSGENVIVGVASRLGQSG
jgi:hypothetical protein